MALAFFFLLDDHSWEGSRGRHVVVSGVTIFVLYELLEQCGAEFQTLANFTLY